jgi:hypothetical protein
MSLPGVLLAAAYTRARAHSLSHTPNKGTALCGAYAADRRRKAVPCFGTCLAV